MLRKSIVAVTLLCGLASTTVQAADITPINSTKKAWIIRYGKEVGEGNKRKDLAVLLKLRENGEDKFKATLVRFDRAASGKYLRAAGNVGKVELTGTYNRPGSSGNARRPVRLKGVGSYVTPQGAVRVVMLNGIYHPGNDTDSREDDRLSVRIRVKSVNANTGNADIDADTNADANTNNSTNTDNTIDVAHFEFVALFQPPCEEEPDTDVLSEEQLPVTDPEIDDVEDLPVDP